MFLEKFSHLKINRGRFSESKQTKKGESTLEATTRNATAKSIRLIQTTPEALRELANRLEHSADFCVRGEFAICELTPSIQVVYTPEVKATVEI
jgi:hypothetical protein